MEAKHTPGPWIITTQPGYSERWVEAPGVDVAEVRSGDADARLIAAAPDLLAALSALVTEADVGGGSIRSVSRYSVDKARAAIDKATGQATGGAR